MPRRSSVITAASISENSPLINSSFEHENNNNDNNNNQEENQSFGRRRKDSSSSAIHHMKHNLYMTHDDTEDYRDPELRASIHASDTGLELHAAPNATLSSTSLNIIANIVGVGILNVPSAMNNCYDSLGLGMLVIVAFMVLSIFSAYVLSVACEYTQVFSQTQLVVNCLIPLQYSQHRNTKDEDVENSNSNSNNSSEHENSSGDDANINNNNNNVSPSFQKLELEAVENAQYWRNYLFTVLDLLFGLTYFLFLISFSRVVADSMMNVSKDLRFPSIFHERPIWLIIEGFVFLILSMRRVFHDMIINSAIGIVTIVFVVIVIVIRFFDQDVSSASSSSSSSSSSGVFNFLKAFATLSSCYAYHINQPSYYQELQRRTPGLMQKPVIISMFSTSVLYAITGIFGYLLFGSEVASKKAGGDVINNFSSHDSLVNVARLALFIHFVCVFGFCSNAVKQCLHRAILRIAGETARAEDSDEVFRVPFYFLAIESTIIVACSVIISGVVSIGILVQLAGVLGANACLSIFPGVIGIYVFSELAEREEEENAKSAKVKKSGSDNNNDNDNDNIDDSVSPIVADVYNNNFLGWKNYRPSHVTSYYLSLFVFWIGVCISVLGLVACFSELY